MERIPSMQSSGISASDQKQNQSTPENTQSDQKENENNAETPVPVPSNNPDVEKAPESNKSSDND